MKKKTKTVISLLIIIPVIISLSVGIHIAGIYSTKNVICGHEHKNNFSVLYRGVRLTYATKTGDGHDWVEDGSVCGGTVLKLDEAEKLTGSPIYLNYDMLNN